MIAELVKLSEALVKKTPDHRVFIAPVDELGK
jgi:hypothetical protein